MSAPTNHWKLGLFVVAGMFAGLGAVVYVGAQTFREETIEYKSYFDEAVTGLDLGSPVRFRGVTLGNVTSLDVAVDRRHVEVTYELGVSELERLGLARLRGGTTQLKVPSDLRVQLASSGLTGTKYLQIDFFPTAMHPVLKLPFLVPGNHIAATPSTMKSLETAVVRATDAIPELTQSMTLLLGQVNGLVLDVRERGLPEKVGNTLDAAHRTLASIDEKVHQLRVKELSLEARAAIVKLSSILGRVDGVVAQMEGQQGLMKSLRRAAANIGDVAGNARNVGPEMSRALGEVRDAAQALRELVSALNDEPDMLLKGRAEVIE